MGSDKPFAFKKWSAMATKKPQNGAVCMSDLVVSLGTLQEAWSSVWLPFHCISSFQSDTCHLCVKSTQNVRYNVPSIK